MPRLRTVWADAWSMLPDSVHPQLSARGTRAPNRRVARVLFATVFGDDQPPDAALPSELRSPRVVFTDKRVGDHEVDRINQAVATQTALLEATAEIYGILRNKARAAGLSGDMADEHLLRRAHEWAASGTEPTADAIAALLAELQGHPSPSKLRDLLDGDEGLVASLDELLDDRFAVGYGSGTSPASPADVQPYLDFLDDEDLDAGTPSALSDELWERTLAIDASAWHHRTAALGLSDSSPPPRPPLRAPEDDEPRPHEWHPRWLDAAIEERVASALRRDVRQRTALPPMPQLMVAEIERVARPLGLDQADSRTVLVLGAQVALRAGLIEQDATVCGVRVVGEGIGQVRASARVRDRFRFWKIEQEEVRGIAGFPKVWAGILADPTTFYLAYLWLRVHHDEIYGRPAYTASTARWAVVAIASTVVDRLKSLPASQAHGLPGANSGGEDDRGGIGTGRAIALFYEIDRIRASVDPDEFTRFFAAAGQAPQEHQDRWEAWTSAAGSTLALVDVLDWLDEHGAG